MKESLDHSYHRAAGRFWRVSRRCCGQLILRGGRSSENVGFYERSPDCGLFRARYRAVIFVKTLLSFYACFTIIRQGDGSSFRNPSCVRLRNSIYLFIGGTRNVCHCGALHDCLPLVFEENGIEEDPQVGNQPRKPILSIKTR